MDVRLDPPSPRSRTYGSNNLANRYTAPVGPKYLGLYVSGTTSWIETFSLPPVYDDRTNGSFTWKCDLPAGLSVAAMFYVVQDGASGTQGAQASTPDAVINAGSAGTSCLGTNDPGSQSKIYSLASSLDPAFSATRCDISHEKGESRSRSNSDHLLDCAQPRLPTFGSGGILLKRRWR